jgi:protein CMS1
VTFRDAKERSLLDIPEVRDDVFKLVLGCPRMTDVIKAGKVQLVMF